MQPQWQSNLAVQAQSGRTTRSLHQQVCWCCRGLHWQLYFVSACPQNELLLALQCHHWSMSWQAAHANVRSSCSQRLCELQIAHTSSAAVGRIGFTLTVSLCCAVAVSVTDYVKLQGMQTCCLHAHGRSLAPAASSMPRTILLAHAHPQTAYIALCSCQMLEVNTTTRTQIGSSFAFAGRPTHNSVADTGLFLQIARHQPPRLIARDRATWRCAPLSSQRQACRSSAGCLQILLDCQQALIREPCSSVTACIPALRSAW